MNIFNIITLFGGLAMFLYGMKMMGNGLKEGSSGALKRVMEKVTGTPVKAFMLGLIMTAVIQSSTATIVITSGLVGAGIISLHSSLGVIIGANVGTTVTGQIIRLLDLKDSGTSFLQFFNPSTLAPIALIVGIILIMAVKSSSADKVGQIVIGFGILFTGLMNMTDAVGTLTEGGLIEDLFSRLGENPLIGYVIGAGVAFVLQSSSATIGILQAFSTAGLLRFSAIYAVLVGIYLGDCVTTAIVCNIGAKPDAKRVGIVNIAYNLAKTLLSLVGVTVAHKAGWIDGLWNKVVNSGDIANANTVFNLACALIMLPFVGALERLSRRLVKDKKTEESRYNEKLNSLSPVFLNTPALAFNACYELLKEMFRMARNNINRSFDLIREYDEKTVKQLNEDEDAIDLYTDKLSDYLVQISSHISAPSHVEMQNYYYALATEFERLGDHATNIAEMTSGLRKEEGRFSKSAMEELVVVKSLLDSVLDYAERAFQKCDADAAYHIEPLEEVVDDMMRSLKKNHLDRLKGGECSVTAGTAFLNLLSDVERISDICSNIGVATIARTNPEMNHEVHDYVARLHSGSDAIFNAEFKETHEKYFRQLYKKEQE